MLTRSPTIRMVTRSLSRTRGGIPPAVRALSRSLVKSHDLSLEVVATEDDYTQDDFDSWSPLQPRLFKPKGPSAFNYLPRLAGHFKQQPCDLIHAHGLWLYHSLATHRWSKATGRPYIVSPHGMLNPVALKVARWKKQLLGGWLYENRSLRGAHCLHALSEYEYEAIRAYGLNNPICVIPNGIGDVPKLEKLTDRTTLPWADAIPEDSKVLMYLGRLHPIKGLDNLIRALGQVKNLRDWHVVLIGWPQAGHDIELKRLAGEQGVTDRVHFLPAQFDDAKHRALAAADAVVLPSRSEAFPVTLLEAWSHGRATAVSDAAMVGAARRNAAAIALGSEVDSMALGLQQLFDMGEEQRHAMGNRGRQLVENEFSWETVSDQFKQVYDWLLNKHSKPICVRLD